MNDLITIIVLLTFIFNVFIFFILSTSLKDIIEKVDQNQKDITKLIELMANRLYQLDKK